MSALRRQPTGTCQDVRPHEAPTPGHRAGRGTPASPPPLSPREAHHPRRPGSARRRDRQRYSPAARERSRIGLDEHAPRGAARQRLQPHGAGAGEDIEHHRALDHLLGRPMARAAACRTAPAGRDRRWDVSLAPAARPAFCRARRRQRCAPLQPPHPHRNLRLLARAFRRPRAGIAGATSAGSCSRRIRGGTSSIPPRSSVPSRKGP